MPWSSAFTTGEHDGACGALFSVVMATSLCLARLCRPLPIPKMRAARSRGLPMVAVAAPMSYGVEPELRDAHQALQHVRGRASRTRPLWCGACRPRRAGGSERMPMRCGAGDPGTQHVRVRETILVSLRAWRAARHPASP
jgi:hypothetical protein